MTDSNTDLQEETPAEPVSDGVAEDVLDKATVSKIVARERQKAYEKGKQEALMSQAQQPDMQQQAPQAPQPAMQTFGGMQQAPQQSPEDIQRMIAEHVPQYLQQQAAEYQNKQFVDGFVAKMQAAEKQFPGLEQKLNDIDFTSPTTQKLVQMANNLDNTGEIMNELLENPEKMGTLLNLVHEQPKLAQNRLASLSNSIKTNREAVEQDKSALEPIGQMKSSVNAGVDEHNLSVKDLKKLVSQRRR
jgi:hypothetical protein